MQLQKKGHQLLSDIDDACVLLWKSHLENDISAITQSAKLWWESGDTEEHIIKEAHRKAKNSFSKKTKKPVIHSQEELNIEIPFAPGVLFKFNMMSPPQIEIDRVFELARLQLMAFFYFITLATNIRRDKTRTRYGNFVS